MKIKYNKRQAVELLILLTIFVLSFSLYSSFVSHNVGGDGTSMYYPTKQLLESNDLNMWDSYNDQYNTYYFKMTFGDNVIYQWGKMYPVQSIGTIYIEAIPMFLFGDLGFFYFNSFLGGLIACVVYLISRELNFSIPISIICALTIACMPLLFYWSVLPQNIIPASLFLLLSFFFIIRFSNNGRTSLLFLAGLMFGICAAIRPTHLVFILGFIPFFYDREERLKFNIRAIGSFILPILIIALFIILANITYFNDPFFQGYLYSDYHPNPPGEVPLQDNNIFSQKYLIDNFSLSTILHTIVDVLIGNTIVYFPLFIISLIGIVFLAERNPRYSISAFIVFFSGIVYYSQMSSLLFRPSDLNYSIDITIFRYLLPAILIVGIGIAPFIERVFAMMHELKVPRLNRPFPILVTILFMIAIIGGARLTYYYDGGASLQWYDGISSNIEDYSKTLDSRLEKGATILFDTRWSFSYLYPNLTDYHWFYYDGVPPDYRFSHTSEIVMKLLEDNEIVYFSSFGPPYNELSQEMENYLSNIFDLTPVDGTYFERMNAQFLEVTLKSEG